jgi:hypothetical protein
MDMDIAAGRCTFSSCIFVFSPIYILKCRSDSISYCCGHSSLSSELLSLIKANYLAFETCARNDERESDSDLRTSKSGKKECCGDKIVVLNVDIDLET